MVSLHQGLLRNKGFFTIAKLWQIELLAKFNSKRIVVNADKWVDPNDDTRQDDNQSEVNDNASPVANADELLDLDREDDHQVALFFLKRCKKTPREYHLFRIHCSFMFNWIKHYSKHYYYYSIFNPCGLFYSIFDTHGLFNFCHIWFNSSVFHLF